LTWFLFEDYQGAGRKKQIEIEYLRPVKGKDFGPATDRMIAKNVDQDTYERLRSRIDYHNSLYQDVAPGDRYSLTYVPGKGTVLALNGETKGTVEGADFASAIFSIWLGPEPISESFKKQIMGQQQWHRVARQIWIFGKIWVISNRASLDFFARTAK
jgi:hypothetical protein